ncbi:MAG: LysR family transcriptional regulator [Clostridiales bacterium]|nr:LysR family transcriptional regulator [Clostridiales bacterium]MDY3745422.1 LysR substrate-binding domain-containing protein [Lachnospiraceae bacterium]
MTLRHMKIFCSICEHHYNITKAAEAMHMTQPAVSLALKELEQYYGVVLFDRIGRKLQITQAGKNFLDYAVHIASLFDDMEKELRHWDASGILRIGASITVGSQFMPSYVKSFYSRYPGTKVHVKIAPSDQLEKELLSNELDFALIEGIAHDPSIVSEEYMEDHLSIICPAGDKYYQGQCLSLEEFKQQNFLLREPGSGTREVFNRVTENAGFSVTPVWEAMSTTALVNAVISGLGISVLPHRMIIGPLERGLIVTIQVKGLDFKRSFRIIYHRQKYLTSAAQAFIDLCRNYELDYPLPKYNALY